MAYNSKAIKTDVNAKPIPQYYNPVTDEYEALQGTGGAARQVLYGPDGNPISVVDNKLAVRAAELEAKIEALNAKLDGVIDGTTPAKTQLTGSFVRKSTDPFPEGKEGDSLYLWDTKQVFLHDGTNWREL